MRVVLLGSSIPNMLNYGLAFSTFANHEFITTLLVPDTKRKECQRRIVEFLKTTEGKNIHIHPIFLKWPDYRLRNLLNVSIVQNDFPLIFKTLKRLAPDVVICYYVLDAYPFLLLRRVLRYSLCVTALGGDVNLHRGLFYRSIRKFIYRGSDLIFAVSYALRDKIERESGYRPIVARTGVDTDFFRLLDSKPELREKWGFRPTDQIMLTVCNLVKHKGVDIAIRALSMLNRECSSAKLAIVGSGPEERKLKELVSTLQLKNEVVFLGIRNRQELLELYNAADVFVLASFCEGLPFVLLEAMACGCVCVASEVGDIPTVITHGINGFLVPSEDSAMLFKAMNHVFSLSKGDAHSIEKRARKTIEKSFNIRNSAKTMVKAIEHAKSLKRYRNEARRVLQK